MNKIHLGSVFFLGLFAVASSEVIKYKDCGSQVGRVDQVEVNPCPKLPCIFKKGEKAGINVKFQSNETNPSATVVVHGIISGIPVPWPVPEANACHSGLTPSCPVKPGISYQYQLYMDVKKSFPSVQFVVKLELKDGDGKSYFCVEFPGEIH